MCQARSKVITRAVEKDLRFVFQSPKRPGMDDARAVPLKLRPVGVAPLRILSLSRFPRFLRDACEESLFVRLHFLPGFPSLAQAGRMLRVPDHKRKLLVLGRTLRVWS